MSYTVLHLERVRTIGRPSLHVLRTAMERLDYVVLAGITAYEVNDYHCEDHFAVIESHTPYNAKLKDRSNWEITFASTITEKQRTEILSFLGRPPLERM